MNMTEGGDGGLYVVLDENEDQDDEEVEGDGEGEGDEDDDESAERILNLLRSNCTLPICKQGSEG